MKLRSLFWLFSLTVFILAFTISVSFADSCPYCGQQYGDPMPGDEARVYALRADHEASCPMRPSASGGGSAGYDPGFGIWGPPTGPVAEPAWVIEQRILAEQERIRQEQEQKRIENIQKEARRRAEAERRRIEWQQKMQSMMGMLKGAASALGLKSGTGGETVELKPKGTEFFWIPRSDREGVVITKTIGGVKQAASPSEIENLRRSLWLYQKAAQAASDEEAHFLAAQADEAVQGHDLRVEVPAAEATPEISSKQLQEFVDLKTQVEERKIQLEEIGKNKRLSEDKQTILKNELKAKEEELKRLEQEITKPPVPVTPPPPSQTTTVTPPAEDEKKKKHKDLLSEILKVKEDLKDVDEELKSILDKEDDVEKDLKKAEESFESFKKRGKS